MHVLSQEGASELIYSLYNIFSPLKQSLLCLHSNETKTNIAQKLGKAERCDIIQLNA